MSLVYKLIEQAAWEAAAAMGAFEGSAVDLADGFIHFSAADQVQETARRHFRGVAGLVLLAVDAEALGAPLRWEPSRGGALFPHLYGPMPASAVRGVRPLALDAEGVPVVGDLGA
ncbi:MAG: DUF952 domain-containing protein [Caulobacteraceae bacterium]|nr:DUF952 domain-containing protein [Caulobacteraceae bacterium]